MVTNPLDPDRAALMRRTYEAFNARDVEGALGTLSPDVDWPNLLDGVRIHGHDEVRDYWLRQFATVDPRVEPRRIGTDPDGRVVVDVHQVIRSLDGEVLLDQTVQHVYSLDGGLITRMDVRDLPA